MSEWRICVSFVEIRAFWLEFGEKIPLSKMNERISNGMRLFPSHEIRHYLNMCHGASDGGKTENQQKVKIVSLDGFEVKEDRAVFWGLAKPIKPWWRFLWRQ